MSTLQKSFHKKLLASALMLALSSSVMADCTYQLFNLSSKKGTRLSEFVDQISEECGYTVLVKDKDADKILRKRLNKTNLQDLIITEVLDVLLKENNLSYELKNKVLKVAYVVNKTYNLDYITSSREGKSKTLITLASDSQQDSAAQGGPNTSNASAGNAESGLTIQSSDEFKLWDNISAEIQSITNRPGDNFMSPVPVINKEAGLVTVSATYNQIKRVDAYIKRLDQKLKNQVMIDVHIYNVTLSDSKATGIDWSQIFALQNGKLTQDHIVSNGVSTFADGKITGSDSSGVNPANLIEFTGALTITDFIKFLQEQGDVRSVSNPKVLTLNNQTAFISVGSQFFYKITQSANQASSGGSTITQNDIVDSVFAGFLLDITPEISEDQKMITLKINPSISETITTVDSTVVRTIPPDLKRTQMSSVITAKNGEQIILGGLISSSESNQVNKVPLLGDIPLLGSLFRSSRYQKSTQELVLVITPRIVEKSKSASLKELGYKAILDDHIVNDTFISEYDNKLIEEVNPDNEK
jgi:general secretion pathway protein D